MTYLREQNYDLSDVALTGASAGALVATLTATEVDFEEATTNALQKAENAGVWDRTFGLQGIWGPMIESWLDELIPEEPLEMVNGRLSLLITPIPSLGKNRITKFESKKDLIKCNMASVHLPFFLDGKLVTDFRNMPHIDGSFLAKSEDYLSTENGESNIIFDWKSDHKMANKSLLDSVNALSKQGIWDLFEQGRTYCEKMEQRGDFRNLKQ